MKLSRFKLLLIAPSILITACGYGLKETYNGIPYNSTNFLENYYNVWNDGINPNLEKNKITAKKDEVALDEEANNVFLSLNDNNFHKVEPLWASYAYTYDKDSVPENKDLKAYGPDVKLSKYSDSFKYGVTSKLFDGQMFCNGDFQQARTQLEPNNKEQKKGMGVLLPKESNDASYFMTNFKGSVVKKDDQNLPTCYSDISLHIGLYLKNDTGYTFQPITYTISNVPTNSGDDHFLEPYAGRWEMYVCFGFSLEKFDTNRLCGFSMQYSIDNIYNGKYSQEEKDDPENTKAKPIYVDEEVYHALMVYEVSFPHTTWH